MLMYPIYRNTLGAIYRYSKTQYPYSREHTLAGGCQLTVYVLSSLVIRGP